MRAEADSGEPACLVERQRFAEEFIHAYHLTAEGRGQAVLVTGPVASGKTELVHDLLRTARRADALVLEAVGLPVTQRYQMGVLRQLTQALPPEQRGPLQAALAPLVGSTGELLRQPEFARVAFAFRDAVQAVAEKAQVVLFIDDIQFADTASLEVVTTLRASGVGRVLSVLVERTGRSTGIPMIHRSLAREQDGLHIALGMLSQRGTADLIARQLGASEGARLAPRWHAATGGNPVLLNALLEDRGGARATADDPPVGEAFARGVMRCLVRTDPTALKVAQVLAVLDGFGSPDLVSGLLGLSVEHAEHAIENLSAMGLASGGQLRHTAVAAAVRASMEPEARAELRLRAAKTRYADGARGSEVAELIEAAGGAQGTWAVHVLREAATQRLAAHDCEQAVRYLRLAEQACENRQECLEITAELACATWRQDPRWAERYATELLAASRQGLLGVADSLTLVEHLLWCGQLAEAIEVLSNVVGGQHVDGESLNRLQAVCCWMPCLYPSSKLSGLPGSCGSRTPTSAGGPGRSLLARAESVLQPGLWDDASATCVLAALITSTYAGRLEDAEALLARLAGLPAGLRGPTWQAVISACEAEVALRRGRPKTAERLARAALDGISHTGWGVMVAGPLSTVIAALTVQKKLDEARRFLEVPMPKNSLRSLVGPHALLARGQFHLAAGQANAALADFTRCGKLLEEWGAAEAPPLPWRRGATAAVLRSGRAQPAVREKSRTQPENDLRALAGELDRMRTRPAAVAVRADDRERGPDPGLAGAPRGELSRAEQRVAILASSGRSNREIAEELHVTVSTVEQHLTRIYRKLGIPGRNRLRGMALATPAARS